MLIHCKKITLINVIEASLLTNGIFGVENIHFCSATAYLVTLSSRVWNKIGVSKNQGLNGAVAIGVKHSYTFLPLLEWSVFSYDYISNTLKPFIQYAVTNADASLFHVTHCFISTGSNDDHCIFFLEGLNGIFFTAVTEGFRGEIARIPRQIPTTAI